MNDLVLITGDLLLAVIVFYGVLQLINFFSHGRPSIAARGPLFPKVSQQHPEHKNDKNDRDPV